jgi:catechol 2,3-dioxygenase-like lactoylglutathione lyase family enzyme
VNRSIALVTLVVREYDEAARFFAEVLRFRVVEDKPLGAGKRWLVVAPEGHTGISLLLARAASTEQQIRIGDQTGGRVFLFLETSDFWNDYHHMQARGVQFDEPPREEPYGTVVVFRDLYGNKWDLLQRKPGA